MQLTEAQSRELIRTHGVYVTEACDRCGQILGHLRYTRRNESGEWCSRACRDGVDQNPGRCRGCGTSLDGKRRGAIYCDRTCRMRTVRKEVRNSANIVNTPIHDKGLTDTISGFGYVGQQEGRKTPCEVSHEHEDTGHNCCNITALEATLRHQRRSQGPRSPSNPDHQVCEKELAFARPDHEKGERNPSL